MTDTTELADVNPILLTVTLAVIFGAMWHLIADRVQR